MVNVHYLKIWPSFFKDVKSGEKQFQVRKNDRNFQIGDTLILEEYDPSKGIYTGAWIPESIIYILDDKRFTKEGFVILGIQEIKF
ncbi:DUF3850 domain-containing protein [Clostridium pasteurianum]|uniref:DUF3850 domain-containing protein n=1 Tax=Clostridium pasteurianum TaxID=1501 RepID=UPI002260DC95|nr:DUF3850 domain-containing protein [Clostridium pasteurianum]UZW13221.1 DUF3850 domain-containing protein [Clostridium pasteurianum]